MGSSLRWLCRSPRLQMQPHGLNFNSAAARRLKFWDTDFFSTVIIPPSFQHSNKLRRYEENSAIFLCQVHVLSFPCMPTHIFCDYFTHKKIIFLLLFLHRTEVSIRNQSFLNQNSYGQVTTVFRNLDYTKHAASEV